MVDEIVMWKNVWNFYVKALNIFVPDYDNIIIDRSYRIYPSSKISNQSYALKNPTLNPIATSEVGVVHVALLYS